MEKWTEKTLRRWDEKHFWHPYTQMCFYRKIKPPIIVSAEGNYLVDIRGRRYLDAVSSIWCIIHGHSKKELVESIKGTADKIQHATTLGLANVQSILLVRELSKLVGLPRVFFSEDGAEAVEVALKVSFSFARRKMKRRKVKFASLQNSYHGDTLGAMSLAGENPFTREYKDIMFRVVPLASIYCFRCPYNRAKEKGERKCSFECFEITEKVIKRERGLSAVFIEGGVQGAGGIIPFPPGYMRFLRDETKKRGILLVVDEVATGFGKTGKMFGFEWELDRKGNLPDIVCLGKGLSGGYLPLAATLCKDEIYSVFEGEQWEGKHFFHGHTFTGNPILCALALENIKIFRNDKVLEKVGEKISYLESRLKKFLGFDIVGDVRGKGFMWGIEFVERGKKPFRSDVLAGWQVALRMWRAGVFVRPIGDVLILNLPLSIEIREIDFLCDVLEESIRGFQMRVRKKVSRETSGRK
ncbi:L-Lysine--8-amino-7-oxononanoate transaminase [bacterium HR19]|nr:L-Lysine--8-amino-7-oxononanoate transaminase [bacterium HR19]